MPTLGLRVGPKSSLHAEVQIGVQDPSPLPAAMGQLGLGYAVNERATVRGGLGASGIYVAGSFLSRDGWLFQPMVSGASGVGQIRVTVGRRTNNE
jgi:hypothetical protein